MSTWVVRPSAIPPKVDQDGLTDQMERDGREPGHYLGLAAKGVVGPSSMVGYRKPAGRTDHGKVNPRHTAVSNPGITK